MARKYTPRRANVKRWLQDAPPYILDVLDSKGPGERYTVIFDGSFANGDGTFAGTYVQFLGMSGSPSHPQGISMWGEFTAYECAALRHRWGKQRVRWLDLPDNIRNHVVARAEG